MIYTLQLYYAEKAERSHKGGSTVGVLSARVVADAELGNAGQLIQDEHK